MPPTNSSLLWSINTIVASEQSTGRAAYNNLTASGVCSDSQNKKLGNYNKKNVEIANLREK